MRAVKNTADGIAVVHVPEPDGPGVLVEPAAIGIRGSDLHIASMGPSPVTIGHEIAGHVTANATAKCPAMMPQPRPR